MAKMMMIPPGSILTISTGHYDGCSLVGVFRAKQTIDAAALRDEWLALYPDEASDYRFDSSAFLSWVVSRGLLEEVHGYQWHLSDYARIHDMKVNEIEIAA